MARLKILALIFSLTILAAQAAPKLYITIDLRDCYNCVRTAHYLNSIDKSLKPALVFRKINEKIAQKVAKEMLDLTLPKESIIVSDSLYFKLNPKNETSMFHVIDDGKILTEESLLKLPDQIQYINGLLLSKPGETTVNLDSNKLLPDTVALGRDLRIFRIGEEYYLFDNMFNVIYFIDKRRNLVKTINARDFNAIDLHIASFGDTMTFYKQYGQYLGNLTRSGRERPKFNSMSLSGDTIFLSMTYHTLKDTLLNGKDILWGQYHPVIAEIIEGRVNRISGIPFVIDSVHLIDEYNSSKRKGRNYYIRVRKYNTASPEKAKILASFTDSNDRLLFKKILEPELPVRGKKTFTDPYASSDWAGNWLYFRHCNQIYNVATGKWKTLPFDIISHTPDKDNPKKLVLTEIIKSIEETPTGYEVIINKANPNSLITYSLSPDFKIRRKNTIPYPENIFPTFFLDSKYRWTTLDTENNLRLISPE